MTGAPEGLAGALAGLRIGQGFDVHRFSEDPQRKLVLGGVEIPGEQGLIGHSDADVVAHALSDALLGSCGLGDLGAHFPDTDDRWRGADSMGILEEVVSLAAGVGARTINADCTVVCEKPRLAHHVAKMAELLGDLVGAPVSIKATRAEGLGAIGRVEGIACIAVALVYRSGPAHLTVVP
jgi:2-C-methyl-D-erythritol 2,4-cyclodiphosphate synthase